MTKVKPWLKHPDFDERDYAISLDRLPDPQHFADGQEWATWGLRVMNERFSIKTQRWHILERLFHHFDAGGKIQPAARWLETYHLFGERNCRCVMSYVVRWVRVRQVERRMLASLSDGAETLFLDEALKKKWVEADMNMEAPRPVLWSVFKDRPISNQWTATFVDFSKGDTDDTD